MAPNKDPKKNAASADPMANRPKHIQEEDVAAPTDDQQFFPRLKVLQALSPECTKGDEKYIPSATPGQLLITLASPELLDGDEGIDVVLLECRKRYVEYTPRKQGGGFVASYDTREDMEAKFTKGNDMQVTIEYLCVAYETMEEEEPVVFILSLDTPSKMSVARKIAGLVEQYKSLSGWRCRVNAVLARNKQQQAYYNFGITPMGWLDKSQYNLVLEHQAANQQQFLPPGSDNSEI
jgi:hypothetical protein